MTTIKEFEQFFEHLIPKPDFAGIPTGFAFGYDEPVVIPGEESGQQDFDRRNELENRPQTFGVGPNIALTHGQNQNGPHVPVSSQAQHVMMEHSMGQGPPQQIPNYYTTGQLVHGGPQQHSHSIPVPITVFHQQLAHRQQVLQASAGSFMTHPHHMNQIPHMSPQYQMGIQQLPYGMTAHGQGHPQQQSFGPGDEIGHMQKSHHEHSPSSPGSKGFRKPTRMPRRADEPLQPMNQYAHAQPFYPGLGYGTVFYTSGMAQTVSNVTGQPLILPSAGQQQPGGLYPQYQGHMYPSNPGGELEHHVGPMIHSSNIAQMPPEVMSGIPPSQHPPVLTHVPKVIQEFVPAAGPPAGVNVTAGYGVQLVLSPVIPAGDELDNVPHETKPETEETSVPELNPVTAPTTAQANSDPISPLPSPAGEETKEEEPRSSPLNVIVKSRIDEIKAFVPATNSATTVTPSQNEATKPNGPSQSGPNPNSHKQGSGPSQPPPPRQNNAPAPAKKEVNPEFPQLGLASTNGPSSGSGSGTAIPAVKGRSWASIASKQANNANGPTNGIIPAESSSSNTSTNSSASSGVTQSVVVPMSEFKSNPLPAFFNADPSFDPSCLSNENDPIALSLGEHLSNYGLNHHSLSLTPRGLSNQSNFCYINATLQSLIACPPFVNLFRSMKDLIGKKQCKATPIIQSVFDFVMEFEPITRLSQHARNKRVDAFFIGANFEPTGIRKVLGLLDGATFKVEGRQEDAEEFLSHLLNGLHDEMIKLIKWYETKKDRMNAKTSAVVQTPVVLPAARNGEAAEMTEEENDEWQVMGPKGKGSMTRKTDFSKSPISEMFLGQMSSLLNRTNTPKTTTLQPFFTLQLDIQDEKVNSVRDALEGLSTKEEVSCSANGQEVAIWKQLSLEVLPIILVLHMKRFVYDKSGNRIYKLDKKVDFGVDLEIGKDLLSLNAKAKYFNTKSRFYKLFSAVYHDGEEAHKGHYVADTFHPSGGSLWGQFGWIRYDDTAVRGVSEAQILNPSPPRVPYLLYYRRVDTLSQAKKGQERERAPYYT